MTFHRRGWLAVIPVAILAAGSALLHRHLVSAAHLPPVTLAVWGAGFLAALIQLVLAWRHRPCTLLVPDAFVAVVIPCYNEDPALLSRVLDSLRAQTRRADRVIVTDDGSDVDYAGFPAAYPEVTWLRTANQGKKHAQVTAWSACPQADIIVTMDSDSALAPNAIQEGLRPFSDPGVAGVAGTEMAYNYRRNLLTRVTSVRSLAFQLFAMSSQSAAGGSVLIAPGAFSLFRGELLRRTQDAYLGETFAGMPVILGDDTMLTFFALMEGKVVQQLTAVSFPAYPESIGHHLRQWTRWMRASTIRQVWRLRYLPLRSYGWWFSVWQLGAFTAGAAATVVAIAAWPASMPLAAGALGGLLAWPVILGCRLFCLRRSDQSALGLLGAICLLPLGAIWYLLVLRQIRFYGMATCHHQGWVTRQKVEVVLHEDPDQHAQEQEMLA